MRKRSMDRVEPTSPASAADPVGEWLDLERLATVEVASESPAHPVESALLPRLAGGGIGWRAASPGTQTIRVVFDEPQRLRRIWLHFAEPAHDRTQEFVLRWSADRGESFHEVVRQQWNFSPRGATRETEDYRVDLPGATVLELTVTPDIGGAQIPASLARLRIG